MYVESWILMSTNPSVTAGHQHVHIVHRTHTHIVQIMEKRVNGWSESKGMKGTW